MEDIASYLLKNNSSKAGWKTSSNKNLFKVKMRSTRAKYKISSKLTKKKPDWKSVQNWQ